MGWMHRKPKPAEPDRTAQLEVGRAKDHELLEPTTSLIEHCNANAGDDPRRYQPVPSSTPDSELPFIDRSVVALAGDYGLLWLAIDNIVYDCTAFAAAHPRGADLLQSLGGSDCSWQFWWFHGKREMAEFGRPLRVGTTRGVRNRFPETLKPEAKKLIYLMVVKVMDDHA
ncbi:hypothetical protein VTK56DRAFT_6210 [Thermocarpiscus australiensis]